MVSLFLFVYAPRGRLIRAANRSDGMKRSPRKGWSVGRRRVVRLDESGEDNVPRHVEDQDQLDLGDPGRAASEARGVAKIGLEAREWR